MSEELKPCPFCGGIAKVSEWENIDCSGIDAPMVECQNCGACFIGDIQHIKEQREKVISAWNRRANAMTDNARITGIIDSILKERDRQDAQWGEQNHYPALWATILGEEYGEFCEAVNETAFKNGIHKEKGGFGNMMRELTHVASVAVSAMECLIRHEEYAIRMAEHDVELMVKIFGFGGVICDESGVRPMTNDDLKQIQIKGESE